MIMTPSKTLMIVAIILTVLTVTIIATVVGTGSPQKEAETAVEIGTVLPITTSEPPIPSHRDCLQALAQCASSMECVALRTEFRIQCHRTPFIPSYCNRACVTATKSLAYVTGGNDLLFCDCKGDPLCEFLINRSNNCLWN